MSGIRTGNGQPDGNTIHNPSRHDDRLVSSQGLIQSLKTTTIPPQESQPTREREGGEGATTGQGSSSSSGVCSVVFVLVDPDGRRIILEKVQCLASGAKIADAGAGWGVGRSTRKAVGWLGVAGRGKIRWEMQMEGWLGYRDLETSTMDGD